MKSALTKLLTASTLGCALLFGALSSHAAPLILTGADLLTHPNVSLPTGDSGTVGSSLQFAGGPQERIIINIDLSALGFGLGGGQSSTGTVAVTNTRITSDSDLWYGLWDGTNFAAISSWDGDRTADQTCAPSDGVNFSETGCGGPTINFPVIQNIGDQATATYGFDLNSGALTLDINGAMQSLSLPGGFNAGGSLSFLIGKGSIGETHQIDGIVIDGIPMPEPTTLALMGLGIAAAGLGSRRRRANV